MYPTQLHSYLLWRSSVKPDAQMLASGRYTASVSLIPATMAGIFVFGWWAGYIVLLSMLTAFLTDFVLHRWVYKISSGTRDGTWVISGLLVALMLPPNVPWALPVLGAAAAVALGKHYLSVDGMPLLQPAIVGLLVLHLLCVFWPGGNPMQGRLNGQPHWPVLARSIDPGVEGTGAADAGKLVLNFFGGDVRKSVTRQEYRAATFAGQKAWFDKSAGLEAAAVHGPRPIDMVKEASCASGAGGKAAEPRCDSVDMLLGYVPGPIGGAGALALALGILLLLFAGVASPISPLFALATMFTALQALAWGRSDWVNPDTIPIHLLTGSTILGLFYMAADSASAPRSGLGKVYAGIAVGLVEVVLRIFTPLAEGIIFSVLIVQALSFVIDTRLAPPSEDLRHTTTGISSSSLGRL